MELGSTQKPLNVHLFDLICFFRFAKMVFKLDLILLYVLVNLKTFTSHFWDFSRCELVHFFFIFSIVYLLIYFRCCCCRCCFVYLFICVSFLFHSFEKRFIDSCGQNITRSLLFIKLNNSQTYVSLKMNKQCRRFSKNNHDFGQFVISRTSFNTQIYRNFIWRFAVFISNFRAASNF